MGTNGGTPVKTKGGPLTSGTPPAWLHPGFQGIVEQGGQLYLCAEVSAPRNGRTVVTLASRPLTRDELDVMSKGLGRIILSQGFSHLAADKDNDGEDEGANVKAGKDVNVKFVEPEGSRKMGESSARYRVSH